MSGPARGRLQSVPRPRTAAVRAPRAQVHGATIALPQRSAQPLAPRAIDALVRLPDARWLDRLLRGRAWIALIAISLIGLVFMQVSMLGMNAGIGQAVEKSDVLSRQNADLRRDVSALSSEERIQREAIANGLVMPPAGDVRYLRSNGMEADAKRAAQVMRAPSDLAKATAEAAAAGAAAVGSTVAGDVAPAPGVTGAAAPDAAAAAQAPAATQTPQAATQTPQTTTEAPQTAAQTQTPAATQQAPAADAQVQQQAPPATETPAATAAGAVAAPGN